MNNIFFPKLSFLFFLTNICVVYSYSQSINKGDLTYVVTTGVPFLRIAADARASGMAECGVATSADNNSGFHNPAKFAFLKTDMGASINFAPWLRQITNDIYLINGNGYFKIAPDHTIGLGLRYFTLGQVNYTDNLGFSIGSAKPYEFCVEGHYAFRLSEDFSIGASARYIRSDLSNGSSVATVNIPAGNAFAVDFATFYSKELRTRSLEEAKINVGINLSNMGTKITYLTVGQPDYLPTNLSLGGAFYCKFDDYNALTTTLQFDKLLVPNPQYTVDVNNNLIPVDNNNNGIPDYKDYSSITGMFVSFGDNPNGFVGEIREIIVHPGLEYSYNDLFFARGGYFYEPKENGGRSFATLGAGLKYNVMSIDFSYVIPVTQQRSPLDNQLRVSLCINAGDKKSRRSNNYR